MVYRCQTLCFKALSLESFWLCPSMSFYSFHLRDIDGIRMVSPATACASSVSTELSCCAKAKGDKAKSLWISGSALPWCWSPWTLSPSWSTTTRRTITTSWSSPPPQSSNHHQIIKSSNHQRFECEQTCSLHLNVKIIGCLNCQKQLSCCNSGGHFGRVSGLTTGWASSRSFARIRSSGSWLHFRWWKKLICWICLGETTKETRKISRIRWEFQNLTWMIQSFQENSIC